MSKRIMILATDGFEQSELEQPKARLEKAGFQTTVVSPKGGQIKGWDKTDWGRPVDVDLTLDEAVGSSRVDLQACKLEYSIVSPK